MKLIVAISLLSVGLANALANYGGCTCEVDDFKERFESLEAQVGEILSLVEFIASKATASPTVTPPELNGCGKPCADVVTRNSTQAEGGYEITFKCYGADVTVPPGEEAACGGPEPPTPMPAPGFGFTGGTP